MAHLTPLRSPLPTRYPRIVGRVARELEVAIGRVASFSDMDRSFLRTVLHYTDNRTHVCFRSRSFLLQCSRATPMRARLLVQSCERARILARLAYTTQHPELRPGTAEWAVGATFLRWEVTSARELETRAALLANVDPIAEELPR